MVLKKWFNRILKLYVFIVWYVNEIEVWKINELGIEYLSIYVNCYIMKGKGVKYFFKLILIILLWIE